LKPRDFLIVGAVAVIGVLALLDTLRSDTETAPPEPPAAPTVQGPNPAPLLRENFPPVPARGSLAFAAGDDCRLRDVSVSAGIEFPLPRIETTCALWAPPLGNRLAYALPRSDAQPTAPFRFLDAGRPLLDLGTFETYSEVVWSGDGQRAAWCESATSGFDYEVGAFDTATGERAVRELDFCPRAYTSGGELASLRDRDLLVDGARVLTAPGHIDQVSAGRDGSLGLRVEGVRIERRVGARLTHVVRLPDRLLGASVTLSPDNCAALLALRAEIHLLNVGCFAGTEQAFDGLTAAWSPDGEWVAVAEFEEIVFHRVVGGTESVRWEAHANRLAWR
jgi:hypothetical protein